MKTSAVMLGLFVATVSNPFAAQAGCRNDQIVYSNSTSFGLSLGKGKSLFSFGSSSELSMPVLVDSTEGCYSESNKLAIEYKKNSRVEKGGISISRPNVKFNNIPSASVDSYVFLSPDPQYGVSAKGLSVMCYEDQVIAFRTMIAKFNVLQDSKDVRYSSVIATGAAAKALQDYSMNKAQAGLPSELADQILTILNQNYGEDAISKLSAPQSQAVISTPSLYLFSDLRTPIASVSVMNRDGQGARNSSDSAFYPRNDLTKLLCTPGFKSSLASYDISSWQSSKQKIGDAEVIINAIGKKIELNWRR